jgi:hypothetical protein
VGRFRPNLGGRQTIEVELPRFLIIALSRRVIETNEELPLDEQCSLDDYIESELVNLVTLRDVAELEIGLPRFSAVVQEWVVE